MQTSLKKYAEQILADHELTGFLLVVPVLAVLGYLIAVHIPALLVGVLLAFILEGIIAKLSNRGIPRTLSVSVIICFFILGLTLATLVGLPRLSAQVADFVRKLLVFLPQMEWKIDSYMSTLPDWLNMQTGELMGKVVGMLGNYGSSLLGYTFANVVGLFTFIVYMVFMPLLVFFLLRDKNIIFVWLRRYLPDSAMLNYLGEGLSEQFGAYMRGKLIEAAVVSMLCWVAFSALSLEYSFTLAVAVGLSVIIPYVGAVAVTFPVVIAAAIQFGFEASFWWVVGLYALIQTLDGQILVPLLFSEVVKIHPVGILIAILVFGTLWGVWGVFFAIPLASIVKVVILVVERRLDNRRVPA